jgi:hypothetical protein
MVVQPDLKFVLETNQIVGGLTLMTCESFLGLLLEVNMHWKQA